MDIEIDIRSEEEGDFTLIHDVIQTAFEGATYSNQKEHLLVDVLREAGALDLSLVAELQGEIVGHIAFSEVVINSEKYNWFGLAPVSVHPNYQNKGIGSKLIVEGLERIKKLGAEGCVLLGEPEYYNRFGFRQVDRLTLKDVPPEYFLVKSFFRDKIPSGTVEYHPLFKEYG